MNNEIFEHDGYELFKSTFAKFDMKLLLGIFNINYQYFENKNIDYIWNFLHEDNKLKNVVLILKFSESIKLQNSDFHHPPLYKNPSEIPPPYESLKSETPLKIKKDGFVIKFVEFEERLSDFEANRICVMCSISQQIYKTWKKGTFSRELWIHLNEIGKGHLLFDVLKQTKREDLIEKIIL